jgi:hypothetical protein
LGRPLFVGNVFLWQRLITDHHVRNSNNPCAGGEGSAGTRFCSFNWLAPISPRAGTASWHGEGRRPVLRCATSTHFWLSEKPLSSNTKVHTKQHLALLQLVVLSHVAAPLYVHQVQLLCRETALSCQCFQLQT